MASKPKYQLDLLEEKRAFAVIAWTDRLKQAGKLAALNALAHYNAHLGFSFASTAVIAKESGYSKASTKTVKRGLVEIEKAGAFEIRWSKGGDEAHRCRPNMSWFRDEYARLRAVGRISTDEANDFADVSEDDTPRAENLDTPGLEPGHPGSTTSTPRVENPTNRTNSEPTSNRIRTSPPPPPQGGTVTDVTAPAQAEERSTSDRMTEEERFRFLRACYESKSGVQQPDQDDLVARDLFRALDKEVGFVMILMGIDRVQRGSEITFAGHLREWSLNGCDIGIDDLNRHEDQDADMPF